MRALFFSLKDVEDELLKNVEEEINVTVDYVWKIFLSIGLAESKSRVLQLIKIW
jgi:hypothetical protein